MRRLDRERDTRWMDDAYCRGIDPELFYPERGESTAEAKAVCRGCAVRAQCLEYALTSPLEKFGVWGGLSERERRRLRRRRRRAALAVVQESAA
jgi:WhiB family redox-sensing transcriptional regulator